MYARFLQTGCTILHSYQQYVSSSCSISYQHLILSGIFIFNHFHRCAIVVSQCGFNLHFPNDCDIDHLIMCLFAIHMYFLVKCQLKSLAHFLNELFVFLLLGFEYSWYVLDMFWISLYRICDFQIVSPTCSFILLMVSSI